VKTGRRRSKAAEEIKDRCKSEGDLRGNRQRDSRAGEDRKAKIEGSRWNRGLGPKAESGVPEAPPAKPQTGASRGEDSRHAEERRRRASRVKVPRHARGGSTIGASRAEMHQRQPEGLKKGRKPNRGSQGTAKGIEDRCKPEGDPEATPKTSSRFVAGGSSSRLCRRPIAGASRKSPDAKASRIAASVSTRSETCSQDCNPGGRNRGHIPRGSRPTGSSQGRRSADSVPTQNKLCTVTFRAP